MRNSPLVLIVDDDAGFQEIIGTKLKRSGFLVAEAHDGKEAIDKAALLSPNLILMPHENGTEAVMDILKNQDNNKNLKIIFLSSMNSPWPGLKEEDAVKVAKNLGASGYINKSEDLDKLIEKIKSFL